MSCGSNIFRQNKFLLSFYKLEQTKATFLVINWYRESNCVQLPSLLNLMFYETHPNNSKLIKLVLLFIEKKNKIE